MRFFVPAGFYHSRAPGHLSMALICAKSTEGEVLDEADMYGTFRTMEDLDDLIPRLDLIVRIRSWFVSVNMH